MVENEVELMLQWTNDRARCDLVLDQLDKALGVNEYDPNKKYDVRVNAQSAVEQARAAVARAIGSPLPAGGSRQ